MSGAAASVGRRRWTGPAFLAGQMRYQLLLLIRSPFGVFTTLVVPVMLLVSLNVVTPEMTLQVLGGIRLADFLTPAMAVFGLINACFVNVVTSVVAARADGVLKRLRGTPLPLWAYVAGRLGAAAVIAAASVTIVTVVGAVFLDVRMTARTAAYLAGIVAFAVPCFTMLGFVTSTFLSRADTALSVAYGLVLPLAFISDVFFPSTSAPSWLQDLAGWLPLAPIARAAERTFAGSPSGWPMSSTEMAVVAAWTAGAALFTALLFRWEPGGSALIARLRGRPVEPVA